MYKKIAFLAPIYPPHYQFARDLLASHHKHNLHEQSDIWIVFTDETEKESFGDYLFTIVLPKELRIFNNHGIINIKKFYGLKQIQEKYPYIIVLDAESLFIRNVNLFAICEEYFTSKILLGNEVFPERKEAIEGVKNSCKRFFADNKNVEKLNNPLYLWFNQPCIYKASNLNDFWNKIDYDHNIKSLQWADFDYYIYMFYLVLFQGFSIVDMDIETNCGICEASEGSLSLFKSNKYETLPIFMASQAVLHIFDNPKCFIAIHLDRNKDWMLRVMSQKIDYCIQKIRDLENKQKRARLIPLFRKLLACFIPSKKLRHKIRGKN